MNDLAQLSLLLIYASMASYTVALVSFSVDLSNVRSHRDAAGKVVRHRQLVATGGGGGAGGGGGVATSAATAGAATPAAADSARRRAAGIAMSTTFLGLVFHTLGVVTRSLAAGHVPWSNMYEFTITLTLVIVGLYLLMARRHDLRYLGAFVIGPTVLMLGVAVAVLYVEADSLRPILDNYWLYLHVSVAIAAVAVLAIAAVLAVAQLAKDFSSGSGGVTERILAPLPSSDDMERISYRFTAVGFVLWTFTLIAGAIWAEHAWGRPWAWDAKEVWTLVIWLIYAAYLHARATRGWDGRRAAYLVLAGFTAVLLNYFVVNFLLSTKHGYAF
ncbi:MAG TPA: c-type cytochrome biogenesis protein CcsB [Actinomycetaceae bacterium]|nr:c-type cytochrome biogenesis protein CcsB [Actinomycetaceae bacterium]